MTQLHCFVLLAAVSVGAPGTASAQVPGLPQDLIQPAPGAAKYAGTYHVATDTWTRRPSQVRAGASDTVYSNTARSGSILLYGGPGASPPGRDATIYDEGGLPGTTNLHPFPVRPDRDVYRINQFQIGYCDLSTGADTRWEVSFFDSYSPCSVDLNPTAVITTGSLPTIGCWFVDIDLTGGMEFDMGADGGDGWDDNPLLDSFGWSIKYVGTGDIGSVGVIIAGDPLSSDPGYVAGELPTSGAGTYFGPPVQCGTGTSGYLTDERFYMFEPLPGPISDCFSFGQYANTSPCNALPATVYGSFHMEILAEAAAPPIGDVYCGSLPNATGLNTKLTAIGSTSAPVNNVELAASDVPPGALGYFLASDTQGSIAAPGGSYGDLCVVGPIGRLAAPGQIKAADANGNLTLSTTLGEWSLTEIPTALPPFSYAATAGITTNFQLWHRDSRGGVGGSNFSEGLALTWR